MQKLETSINGVEDLKPREYLSKVHAKPWKPFLHEAAPPWTISYSIVGPENAIFLLYQPYHGFNFGHFLWDDLLPLFSMMDLFDMADKDGMIPVRSMWRIVTKSTVGDMEVLIHCGVVDQQTGRNGSIVLKHTRSGFPPSSTFNLIAVATFLGRATGYLESKRLELGSLSQNKSVRDMKIGQTCLSIIHLGSCFRNCL